MKILVFGSNGFVGRSIVSALEKDHEVWKSSRVAEDLPRTVCVDLNDADQVNRAVQQVTPEVVINAAGVVENTDDSKQNVVFTKNILGALALQALPNAPKLILCGSAAEYGYVDPDNIPVSEDCPQEPYSVYGKSKQEESRFALDFGQKNNISVVVARIFNPIGLGMGQKFIIPRLLSQVRAFTEGSENTLVISRKDSLRDYVDVRDLARAIAHLCGSTKQDVYNIGSGVATSNEQLVLSLLNQIDPSLAVSIVETSEEPEKQVACRADISRMQEEFSWSPRYSIDDTIKEVLHEEQ